MGYRLSRGALLERAVLLKTPTGLTVVSAVLGRAVTALSQFMLMRLLLSAMPTDEYAAYVLLSSLATWFLLADFGIGASVQNYISEQRAHGRSGHDYVRFGVRAAFLAILVSVLVAYLLSLFIGPLYLERFGGLDATVKRHAFFLAGSLLAITGAAGIAYKIWYAEKRGYLSNIVPTLGYVVSLGCIALLVTFGQGPDLIRVILLTLGPIALAALLATLYHVWRCPVSDTREAGKRVLRRAASFFSFGVLAAITLRFDYIFMSQTTSANDIILYNLHERIFNLALYVHSAVMSALWPVFTEAVARREWDFVLKNTRRIVFWGMLYVVVATLGLVLIFPFLLQLVDPQQKIHYELTFTVVYGIYAAVILWVSTYSTILQSMSDMRMFIIGTPIQALIALGGLSLLAPLYGAYGVILALMASYLLFPAWFMPMRVYRFARGRLSP